MLTHHDKMFIVNRLANISSNFTPRRNTISISGLKSFRNCRRAFKWSSSTRDNLEPKEPSLPFFTGSVIHSALEAYYGTGKVPLEYATMQAIHTEKLKAKALGVDYGTYGQVLKEQEELSIGIMQHYKIWLEGKVHSYDMFADSKLEFLAVETAFNVPIYTPSNKPSPYISFVGRFDGVVMLSDGTLWLWENKTSSRINELVNSLDNDEQATGYIYALQEIIGYPVSGVIYNILLKKVPTHARVLKSGSLSTAKNISASFESYLQDIKSNHPEYDNNAIIRQYGSMLDMLKGDNKFFKRIAITRTQEEINAFKSRLYTVGLEAIRQSTVMYSNPSYNNCRWCRFKTPCLQADKNENYKHTLATEYKKRGKLLVGETIARFRIEPITEDRYIVFRGQSPIEDIPQNIVYILIRCLEELTLEKATKDYKVTFLNKVKQSGLINHQIQKDVIDNLINEVITNDR